MRVKIIKYNKYSFFRKVLRKLSYEAEFNRDDFIVEYFSTFVDDVPKTRSPNGRIVPDLSLFAPDCFHFMKELHSRIGV